MIHNPAHGHRDRCAIAGIGATDFSRRSGRSDLTLAIQASRAALADAGLVPAEVDGIVRCDMDLVRPSALAEGLGLEDMTFWAETGPGGVAPCAMIGLAVGAILSGQATTVLAFRSLNGRSGTRYGSFTGSAAPEVVGGHGTYDELYVPWGLLTPGQTFALMARRHMVDHGTTPEQLARIPLACRERANQNPAAQMHDRPLTLDDYLTAREISSPLRLFDFCLESDGACAVVVTSAERAADLRQPPVLVRAVAQASGPEVQAGTMFPVLTRSSITETPAAVAAGTLYRRAGLGPDDIDVAQLYDCFSITALLQLEDYGFCGRGEGGPFVADGGIDLEGRLPINTAGGHLSEGYIHGMNHVLEGVRQMRGTSTAQVEGAEVCLVTSAPPPGTSALLLRAA